MLLTYNILSGRLNVPPNLLAPRLTHAHLSIGAFSERHLRIISTVPTLVRAGSTFVIAAATLLDPTPHGVAHRIFMAALMAWSAYRLIQNASTRTTLALDFTWVPLAGIFTPALESATQFELSRAAPLSIVAVSVCTLAVQLPLGAAFGALVLALTSYGWGAAQSAGWTHAVEVDDLYRILFGWGIAVFLRLTVARLAEAVDKPHTSAFRPSSPTRSTKHAETSLPKNWRYFTTPQRQHCCSWVKGPLTSERLATRARRDLQRLQAMPRADNECPSTWSRCCAKPSTASAPIWS